MGVFDDLLEQDKAAAAAPTGPAQATAPAVRPGVFSDLGDPTAAQPTPRPAYHGAIVPFSRDSGGNVYFDPMNAGPLGSIKQAATLPGRVVSGETKMPLTFNPKSQDPRAEPMIGEVLNFGGTFGPMNPAVRSGDKIIPGVATRPADMSRAVTPSSAELLKEGGKQHDIFRDMPIAYDPKYMGTLADQIKNKLVKEGVNEEDSPNLYKTIDRMYNYVPKSDDPTAQILLTPSGLITSEKASQTSSNRAVRTSMALVPLLRRSISSWRHLLRTLFWLDPLPKAEPSTKPVEKTTPPVSVAQDLRTSEKRLISAPAPHIPASTR